MTKKRQILDAFRDHSEEVQKLVVGLVEGKDVELGERFLIVRDADAVFADDYPSMGGRFVLDTETMQFLDPSEPDHAVGNMSVGGKPSRSQ